MKKIILLFCVVSIVACAGHKATPSVEIPAGPFPHDYEHQIKAWFNQNAIDPGSIKFISIDYPIFYKSKMGFISGLKENAEYWKCRVVVNGKNRMGGYTGPQKKDFFFKNGVLAVLGYGYTDYSD